MEKYIYQIKVSLQHLNPPIWRRILISSEDDLGQLHAAIQITMGWENAHLHRFEHDDTQYLPEEFSDDEEGYEGIPLSAFLKEAKDEMLYIYDFGDHWEHTITLEKILPFDEKQPLPYCLDGKMACPPEGCGGFGGYEHLVEVMKDPKHEDYKEQLSWLGGKFDPEDFMQSDIDDTNRIFEEYRQWKLESGF